MAWADPKNDYAGDVVTNDELNQRANNQIQLGSMLHLGTALKSLSNGTELHYGMGVGYINDTTERSYTITASSTWETHSTATKLAAFVAKSTRPILILVSLKCKVSALASLVRIHKFSGNGGTERKMHQNFSNTSYFAQTDFLFYILESPVKGNSYTFALEVFSASGTPTVDVDDVNWFAISL